MKIDAGAASARLVSHVEDERDWLSEFLTFETVTFVGGKPRPTRRGYLSFKDTFPVGLVPMVERHAAEAGFPVVVNDVRGAAPPADPAANLDWLYDWQREVIDTCLLKTRGVVSSPTGSGKGEMIPALCWARDCRWLTLVYREQLALDLADRYRQRTGLEPGYILSKTRGRDPKKVTFGTFQSFYAWLKDPEAVKYAASVQGLIVDEAHTVAADTFYACASACRQTFYRFGFSGTPFDRQDSKSIAVIAAIGPRIAKIPTQFLIENGYISRPFIFMVPCHHPDPGYRKFATAYKHLVERSARRNALCLEIMQQMRRPGMCFVKKKDHGKALVKAASEAGINIVWIDGNRGTAKRQRAAQDLERGALDLVMSTVVMREGVNVPSLRSVANFAGGKSTIDVLQKAGRGMRIGADGTDTFDVWDIYDGGQKWLADHSRGRAKAYHREGHDVWLGPLDADPSDLLLFDPEERLDWRE